MIELLDDFFHVTKACSILKQNPADRLIINAINCFGGENIIFTRVASLIVIAIAVFLLLKLFKKLSWLNFFIVFIHPIVLFPFFYASQFSTAITACWAAALAIIVSQHKLMKALPLTFFLILSFIGPLFRFESCFFFYIFVGAYCIFDYSSSNTFDLRKLKILFLKLICFQGIFTAGQWALKAYNLYDATSLAEITTPPYPVSTYYFTQLWSICQYLWNFIFPGLHSFYGNFSDWWYIHESLVLKIILAMSFLFLLGWTIRKISVPGKYRNIYIGLFIFIGSCAVFSCLPRNDWYYPARSYLGTIILLIFLLIHLEKQERLKWILGIYFFISSLYSCFYHYYSVESFYKHESRLSWHLHPFTQQMLASEMIKKKDYQKAQNLYIEAYKSIPIQAAFASPRSAILLFGAAYGVYETSIYLHDEQTQARSMEILMRGTFFVNTHACLQDAKIPLADCVTPDRKRNFCNYIKSLNLPRLHQMHPYRLGPEEICK